MVCEVILPLSACLCVCVREGARERASAYSLLVAAAVETGEDKAREGVQRDGKYNSHSLSYKDNFCVHNKLMAH